MKPFAFVLAGLLAAAPAAAQESRPTVSFRPGDAATVRISSEGDEGAVEPGAARWNPHDLAVARHMVGQPIPDAPVATAENLPGENLPPPEPVAPNQLRLRFHSIAGRHSLLIIENGYDRAIVYQARMVTNGRQQPTDVCLVMPGRRGYEHWPHPIDRLELSGFTMVPWQEGEPIPCH